MENIDFSPEYLLRLGAASGSGSCVGICTDGAALSETAAGIITGGARASGAAVYDFGRLNLPIMREAVRLYSTSPNLYVYTCDGRIGLRVLDERGISAADAAVAESGFGFGTPGTLVNVTEFKNQYIKKIIDSVKSESFHINMCLSTRSELISEIIGSVLGELYGRLEPQARNSYEFSGSISDDGERLTLLKTDGGELSRGQMLSVIFYVLLRESAAESFVLPEYTPPYTEAAVKRMGGRVVHASGDDNDIMRKILETGSPEQMLMQYDGLYAAVRIFDFLNRSGMSFRDLYEKLPMICRTEAEVECPAGRIDGVIGRLGNLYSTARYGDNGLSVSTGGGLTIIVPYVKNGRIKIISEFESMEAAEEISALFKNKIKTLAKE